MTRLLKLDRETWALAILFVALWFVLFKPWVHGMDTVAYYSWLRSAVIDGDLQVRDEFEHYGYGNERGTSSTGYTYNEWAVGSAILWSPFFLIAHGISFLLGTLGVPVAMDGYGEIYIWAVSMGSALYAFAGLLMTGRLLHSLFNANVAFIALVSAWLASSLVFYMYSHPLMSHANDMFVYALFLTAWFYTRSKPTPIRYALLGFVAGLCALVHTQNAILVFFPFTEIVFSVLKDSRTQKTNLPIRQGFLQMASFSAMWWITFSPQMLVWHTVYGTFIQTNPYIYGSGSSFDFTQPQILKVLLSTDRGLFLWTPITILGVVGWISLFRRDSRLAVLLVSTFVLQLYLIASWSSWNGAAAFGQRFFTNQVPAFAFGLATLIDWARSKVALRWIVGASILFIGWNGILMIRYVLEDVPRMGTMPLDQFILGQFTILPRQTGRVLQILFQRH